MKRLRIIDSTTITLFSNLIFKGVGRHPKTGRKKGGIKAHTVIHANEGVPSDVRFTSAATNDSFMLKPASLDKGDILAIDRADINYEKFEELTKRGVVYLTKMKKGLTRSWSFSGLATMVRIMLMYYVDFYSLFDHPEKNWEAMLKAASEGLTQLELFT